MTPILALVAAFTLISDQHGVEIQQNEASQMLEFHVDGLINSPPEYVAQAILDIEDRANLEDEVIECRILRHGDHSMDVYQRLSLPVITDRDYTLHVTWDREADATVIRFNAENELGPDPVDGVVRVNVHQGAWTLTPGPNGSTHARFVLRFDLGGSVPRFLIRSGASKSLTHIYQRLRNASREKMIRAASAAN